MICGKGLVARPCRFAAIILCAPQSRPHPSLVRRLFNRLRIEHERGPDFGWRQSARRENVINLYFLRKVRIR
jgi:hypothetical protein